MEGIATCGNININIINMVMDNRDCNIDLNIIFSKNLELMGL